MREAVEQAMERKREEHDAQRFVQGYQALPQTEEEFGWSDVVALDHLAEQPVP